MTDNPYYELLALIRAQQAGDRPKFFTARLQQLSPPVFTTGETVVLPGLIPVGMVLGEADLQAEFLCLWLEGQILLLCRLEEAPWR